METPSPVRPARPDERADALRLLFHDFPVEERDRRVANALDLLLSAQLDPDGMLVESNGSGVCGVVVCLPVPGASALFWPPRSVPDSDRTGREDRLVRHALAWVRKRGAKLAQSLLSVDEMPLAGPLERNGFRHVTRLWYLAHDLALPVTVLSTQAVLEFREFDPGDPTVFQQTLLRTYEGTLDCPEISGVREIEEVIAGHQAQGQFQASRWWLTLERDQPVGVLLTTLMPESGDWDISYLGIVPEARRRGFGREIVLHALAEAKVAGAGRVSLSVDARNGPALQLYGGLRFAPYDRREVYLAIGH